MRPAPLKLFNPVDTKHYWLIWEGSCFDYQNFRWDFMLKDLPSQKEKKIHMSQKINPNNCLLKILNCSHVHCTLVLVIGKIFFLGSRANNGFYYEGWIFILRVCFFLKTMNDGSVRIGQQGNNNSNSCLHLLYRC